MSYKRAVLISIPILLSLAFVGNGFAADSVDQILEKARAKAGEIAKLKKIINEEPDLNVRLAAFELMVNNGDSVMHEIAMEAGLASPDKLLQSAAFKAAIMDLEQLHLTLVVDDGAPEKIQKASQAYLEKKGAQHVLSFKTKDAEAGTLTGTFSLNERGFEGEVTGTRLTYTQAGSKGNGSLSLNDDNAVSGKITVEYGGVLKFFVTGSIR